MNKLTYMHQLVHTSNPTYGTALLLSEYNHADPVSSIDGLTLRLELSKRIIGCTPVPDLLKEYSLLTYVYSISLAHDGPIYEILREVNAGEWLDETFTLLQEQKKQQSEEGGHIDV